MYFKIIMTIIVFSISCVIDSILGMYKPIAIGNSAAMQFDSSDAGYMIAQAVPKMYGNIETVVWISCFLTIILIWRKSLMNILKNGMFIVFMICASLIAPNISYSYYEDRDYPEQYEVPPNYSAWLIPLQGDNETSQKQFTSIEYFEKNKVATKRVDIKHVLLHMPLLSRDKYVPAVKLILVDRTPYSREWVSDVNKGTNSRDEGFDVESAGSVNINVGIAISASVDESNASKFLYYFGVKPNKKNNNGDEASSAYESVAYGKSLADVMDSVVRLAVERELSQEFGKRSTDDCIKQKSEIMDVVQKNIKEMFAPKGITIEFVGLATPLNYDKAIQKAINESYIALKEVETYDARKKMLDIRTAQADIDVKEAIAAAISKWNGQLPNLPSFMFASDGFMNWISGAINGKQKEEVKPSAK